MLRLKYILLHVLLLSLFWGCQQAEVLETYEQVKEQIQPVPFIFEPYVLSQTETTATTRADLSYLSYVKNHTDNNQSHFNFIPCLGLKTGTANTWGNKNDPIYNFRFGRTATNSYIVGVYAYSHANDWTTDQSTVSANVLVNQPLLRVPNKTGENSFASVNINDVRELNTRSHWDYEPKKYWPVGEKVTFISYYPYQDYEGGQYFRAGVNYPNTGEGKHANEKVQLSGDWYWDPDDPYPQTEYYDDADLTYITPPAAGAIGTDAFTFKFRQVNNVQKHIDFLLGKKTYESQSNVELPLKHTLCAVQFSFENLETNWGLQTGQTEPKEIKIKVNSIGFKGLYTKGDVYHDVNGDIQWESLANYDDTEIAKYGSDENAYIVEFDDNTGKPLNAPFMKANVDDRPTFTYTSNGNGGGSWSTFNRTIEKIYNNGAYNGGDAEGGNSRGFRYLLLVIPQTVNNNDNAYFVMDYDYSYTWAGANGDEKVSFKHTISKIRLSDGAKDKNKTKLFIAGKLLVFKVKITPAGIGMDVQETDWDDALDRQLPVDEKETESGS